MNYTTNYHLPQWVESDRILMEDFNEAMEAIDTGLGKSFSQSNRPYVSGSFTVPAEAEAGDAVLTLGFQPHHILLTEGSTIAIRQGGTEMLYTSPGISSSGSRYLTFQLNGKQLILRARGSSTTGRVTVSYVAYR